MAFPTKRKDKVPKAVVVSANFIMVSNSKEPKDEDYFNFDKSRSLALHLFFGDEEFKKGKVDANYVG